MNLHYDSLFAIPIIQRLVPDMEDFNDNLVENLVSEIINSTANLLQKPMVNDN